MGRPSTREKLLDCAEELFAEHGLEGVSLRAINAQAGLSPAWSKRCSTATCRT
jgi:AcrR family transcriptional regulator